MTYPELAFEYVILSVLCNFWNKLRRNLIKAELVN